MLSKGNWEEVNKYLLWALPPSEIPIFYGAAFNEEKAAVSAEIAEFSKVENLATSEWKLAEGYVGSHLSRPAKSFAGNISYHLYKNSCYPWTVSKTANFYKCCFKQRVWSASLTRRFPL